MFDKSKVRYIAGALLLLSLLAASCDNVGHVSNYQTPSQTNPSSFSKPNNHPVPNVTPPPAPSTAPNGYYKNKEGDIVPSPYQAPSAPQGASARCSDGSYSFSQHRQGTCSHHGGVSEWLQ